MRLPNRENQSQRDSELLAAIAQGDRKALETLYLAYHRRLARFLSRVSPSYESVEEIINDTFMVVWQNACGFRGSSQVSTWIIGIAYRTALKTLRHNQAQRNVQLKARAPDLAVDPNQQMELQDWIAQALAQLPLEQRMVLELTYHLGHSVEEIALITDSPVGTVKARMFHAREKLRHFLPVLADTTLQQLCEHQQ